MRQKFNQILKHKKKKLLDSLYISRTFPSIYVGLFEFYDISSFLVI